MGKRSTFGGPQLDREPPDDAWGSFYDDHAGWMLLYVRRLLQRFHPVPATLTDAQDVLHAFMLHAFVRGWLDRKDIADPRRFYRVAIWRWVRNECRRERSRRSRLLRGILEKRLDTDPRPEPGPLCRLVDQERLPEVLPVALDRFRSKHPTYAVLIDVLLEWAPRRPSPDLLAAKLLIPRHRVADRLHRARCAFRRVLLATMGDLGLERADLRVPP